MDTEIVLHVTMYLQLKQRYKSIGNINNKTIYNFQNFDPHFA